jgi:hypothetical protein
MMKLSVAGLDSSATDPLRRIMADFDRSASATLAQESDLVRTLMNFHCSGGRISKLDARRLITCLAEIFRQFASSQPSFQAMSGADQFRLLVSRPVQETFFSEIPRDSISRPLKPQSETMFFRQNIFLGGHTYLEGCVARAWSLIHNKKKCSL